MKIFGHFSFIFQNWYIGKCEQLVCSVDFITALVDTTDITIIPTINPDGFDRGTEGACSGADYRTGRYNEGGHTGGILCRDAGVKT